VKDYFWWFEEKRRRFQASNNKVEMWTMWSESEIDKNAQAQGTPSASGNRPVHNSQVSQENPVPPRAQPRRVRLLASCAVAACAAPTELWQIGVSNSQSGSSAPAGGRQKGKLAGRVSSPITHLAQSM